MDVLSQVGLSDALAIAPPNEGDVKYASLRGLLTDDDVVGYFVARMTAGSQLSETAERIALLLSDERDRVRALISELHSPVDTDSRRFWIVVSLRAALTVRPQDIQNVEDVYEFFDSDETLLPLVPWVRLDSPMPTDEELFDRVGTYVDRESAWARRTRT